MNFEATDSLYIPIAYLLEDYRTNTPGWALECEFTNTTGAAIEILTNVTVEVSLIPSTLDLLDG